MGIVGLPVDGISEPTTGLLGGSIDGDQNMVITFFRELRQFLEVPIVDAMLRKKLEIANAGGNPDGNTRSQRQPADDISKTRTKKDDDFTPEDFVVQQLATKEGRQSLAKGIGSVKELVGDCKLSDVMDMLVDEVDITPKKAAGTKKKGVIKE